MRENTAIFAATSNRGKLRDFAAAAAAHQIRLEPLPGLETLAAPVEDQSTFAGNARLKAIYYSRFKPGAIVIADDSGLEVDALDGAPGVYSARFAGEAVRPEEAALTQDERNNRLLLDRLSGVERRTARYRCVLIAARDGRCLALAEGTVEGEIMTAPRGTGGFGYDPLFYLPGRRCTMAEVEPEARHQFSHRGKAFRHLLEKMLERELLRAGI